MMRTVDSTSHSNASLLRSIEAPLWSPLRWLRDALFPVFCLGCEREGTWLCSECQESKPALPIQRCLFCRVVSPAGQTCRSCARHHTLQGVIVRGEYHDWLWRDLIHTWKYGAAEEIGNLAEAYIAEITPLIFATTPVSQLVVIPVPLARRRHNDRGFNQAQVLASAIADTVGAGCVSAVRRTRETTPQADVEAEARRENVSGAFRCQSKKSIIDKHCLIVDDIVTTGATLEEIARVLKEAGARSVSAVALTRSDLKE